jgi:hypothetical protein
LPLKWQATFVKPTSEAAAISAAKTAIVGTIEAKMPRVTFEAWLRDLVGDKPAITWEVNDCGEQTGSPVDRGRDTPICVEARVELAVNRQLGLLLAAGSNGRGLSTDPPAFYYGYLKGPGPSDIRFLKTLAEVSSVIGRSRRSGADAVFFSPPHRRLADQVGCEGSQHRRCSRRLDEVLTCPVSSDQSLLENDAPRALS